MTRRGAAWVGALLLWLAAGAVGQAQDVPAATRSAWTADATSLHRATQRRHKRWVQAYLDTHRPPAQRACLDRIADRAGALAQLLEDRARVGRLTNDLLEDVELQLGELDRIAEERCQLVREGDGVTQRDFWLDPWHPRMRRDRAVLRLGLRFELVPRAPNGSYQPVLSYPLRGALGFFPVPWLRLEATVSAGTIVDIGPHLATGGRALLMLTPWGLFRLALGVGGSLMFAVDRIGGTEFTWVGPQLELPLEVGFELSRSVGITVTGGLLFTHPGEARLDVGAFGGFAGALVEVVL